MEFEELGCLCRKWHGNFEVWDAALLRYAFYCLCRRAVLAMPSHLLSSCILGTPGRGKTVPQRAGLRGPLGLVLNRISGSWCDSSLFAKEEKVITAFVVLLSH